MLCTEDLVLVATDNTFHAHGIGHVYAFEQATGHVRWKHRSKAGIPTDVVRAGPRVFAVTLDDELLCLDLHTGNLLWKFAGGTDNPEFLAPASVAVAGQRAYFAALDGTVYALSADRGEILWKRALNGRVTASPVIWRGQLFVGTAAQDLYRLNCQDGAIMARLTVAAAPTGTPVCTDAGVLVFLGAEALACVDFDLARVRWQFAPRKRWRSSRPWVQDGAAVVAETEGHVIAVGLQDGRERWSGTLASGDIRSISGAGDVLYVGTQQGALSAWRTD